MKLLNLFMAPLWIVTGIFGWWIGQYIPGTHGRIEWVWWYGWVVLGWLLAIFVSKKLNPELSRWLLLWPIVWVGCSVIARVLVRFGAGDAAMPFSDPALTTLMLCAVTVLNHRAVSKQASGENQQMRTYLKYEN